MAKRKAEKVETPETPVAVAPPEAPPEVPSSFESPDSSLVMRGSYDDGTETLLLTLRAGKEEGKTYRYNGFPRAVWAEFVQSDSKGRFFAARIRPSYIGRVHEG